MEIKVGEYVRTIDGYIRKVTQINEKGTYQARAFGKYETDVDYKNSKCISEKKITKHSSNIIDILEPGDYINGIKVDYVFPPLKLFADAEEYLEDEIKTIVTKEQFAGMEYKV